MKIFHSLPALLVILCGFGFVETIEAAEQPEAWPCEQVFVSEVSASVLWIHPALDAIKPHAWRNDRAVAKLVRDITSQFSAPDNAEIKVSAYLQTIPADQKNEKLSLAFSGVLTILNDRRAKYMQGILKFSRQQTMRAVRINDDLNLLTKLRVDDPSGEETTELTNKLVWQQRMFDDKERSIRFLCEQPVNVEVAIADLARTLSNNLDE